MSRTEETVPERTRYWLKTLIGFKTVSAATRTRRCSNA